MSEITKETEISSAQVFKTALKTFVKYLFIIIATFFFILTCMFVFSPQIEANLFKVLGLKHAEEACYVRVYEKSQNKADLYNLVMIESNLGDYQKELYYLNILVSDESFDQFCKDVDASAKNSLDFSNKEIIAYACNTKSYLINQKVKCLYELGYDSKSFICKMLSSDYIQENSFSTYVDLVSRSSLSDELKKEKLTTLMIFSTLVDNEEMKSVSELLDERLNKLKIFLEEEISIEDKIVASQIYMNLSRVKYIVLDKISSNADDISNAKDEYISALQMYKNLIK